MERDQRPHIIIATTAFAPFIGGAEIAIEELIRRLSVRYRFTIVTARMDPSLPRHETLQHGTVRRVGYGGRFDKWLFIVRFPFIARDLFRHDGASGVWAVMASYAGAGACLAQALFRIPYVLMLQEGDDLGRLEVRLGRALPLFKTIFSRARAIQAIAPFLADWAVRMGARVQPIVIPNGVTVEVFELSPEARLAARARVRTDLHIPHDAPVVLSISRLVEKNGTMDLIDAVALTDHHVLIVGDGILRSELEARSKALSGRIHFLGARSQTEISLFAAASDIFCRPSHSEGLGIVFLEALAAGLPVVATTVGGIPSIITNGVHGLLVEPHDVDAIRRALCQLTTDQALYDLLQQNGKEQAKRFSWDRIAPHIDRWLSDALVQSCR